MTPSPDPSAVPAARYSRPLHAYAVLVVLATFALVILGGNVTSRDAGMAVPDGFTVFGHFLWTFPVDQWVGPVYHEHIHRLKGSVVGLLCIGLTIWLWRTQRHRPWLQWTGVGVLAAVIVQGCLGALRVEVNRLSPDTATLFRVFHGVTGQLFLCLTVLTAAATSRWWIESAAVPDRGTAADEPALGQSQARVLRMLATLLFVVLLIQLVLGAWMRHTGAGRAIPDFPTSWGAVAPPFDTAGLEAASALRHGANSGLATPLPSQVLMHFAHRVWALAVVLAVAWVLYRMWRFRGAHPGLWRPTLAIGLMLLTQVTLGALTVWANEPDRLLGVMRHDYATAHQGLGAALLATTALLVFRLGRLCAPAAGAGLPRQTPAASLAGVGGTA